MKYLFILLAMLLVASPAGATKPETDTFAYWSFAEIADCGDFSVMDEAWVIEDVKVFYDKGGNFVRSHMKFTAFDDLYRDDDPDGIHLTGTAHLNARVSLDENGDALWTQQGIAIAIVVPGYGPLFLDVGRLVFNMDNDWELIFSAGKHHDWNFGEFDALCEYFDQG